MSRIPVRRGVSVVALLTGPSAAKGIPHVTGVRTIDGEEVFADLVVDAIGRRSKLDSAVSQSAQVRFGFDLGRPTAIQTTIPSIGDKIESAGKAHYRLPKRETKGTAAT